MSDATFARHVLGFWPTPVVELPALSDALGGPRLWMKRDDQSGLALGGNKTRKLEYLVADALAQGADTLVTAGSAQSNHCRQTAAAAAATGLGCHLVLGGAAPAVPNGNLLLDRLHSRTEGILLDPVYTGRAMDGLVDLVRGGRFAPEDRVLFWHTGGTPALFAHADALIPGSG